MYGLEKHDFAFWFEGPSAEPVAVDAHVELALRQPLGYPPLGQTVFLGDRVTLAVAPETPQAGAIAAAVAAELVSAGCRADDVCILLSADEDWLAAEVREAFGTHGAAEVECVVHEPATRGELAFLAHTGDQMPIVLNRRLVEADVSITIGCMRGVGTLAYDGPGGDVYAFSDETMRRRFRDLHATEDPLKHAQRAKKKADELLWLLGGRFIVQVLPDGGGNAGMVLAGDLDAVADAGQDMFDRFWRYSPAIQADLVAVILDGDPSQQTWQSSARALASAASILADDGAVAILGQLHDPPGEGLSLLHGEEDLEETLAAIRRGHPADAVAAMQFARALDQCHVYLLSDLEPAIVEDLGMAPLADEGELARLVRRHEVCALIRGAQFARPKLE